ncbi:MAG: hypothetical protein GC145_08110 [Caulobacter sp.]|nr:hypothetical protein [Caulobacter sp.]
MSGITDWDEKIAVLKVLLNAVGLIDITDAVYPSDDEAAESLRIAGLFRKWRRHVPRQRNVRFFDDLARRLGCPPEVSGIRLIASDIDSFIALLPAASQAAAKSSLCSIQDGTPPDLLVRAPRSLVMDEDSVIKQADPVRHRFAESKDPQFAPMQFLREGVLQSVRDGIKAGKIDQKHYYLAPDATEIWYNLVGSEAYPTYDICKTGLRALANSTEWTEAIEKHVPSTVVMLAGGGSPTKDLVILQGLLQQQCLKNAYLTYLLVDISPYMLVNSFRYLDRLKGTIPGGERVDVGIISADMLGLHERGSSFRSTGNVLFGITGGTIGNISENAFFASLNSMSDKGDLLILSADTIGGDSFQDVESRLKGKYDHEHMRKFISPAMRMLMADLDLKESLSDLYGRMDISLAMGHEAGLSDVAGSMSVRISLNEDGRDITLLSSTRYDQDRLLSFAKGKGWSLIVATHSPLDAKYVQFFLRKD